MLEFCGPFSDDCSISICLKTYDHRLHICKEYFLLDVLYLNEWSIFPNCQMNYHKNHTGNSFVRAFHTGAYVNSFSLFQTLHIFHKDEMLFHVVLWSALKNVIQLEILWRPFHICHIYIQYLYNQWLAADSCYLCLHDRYVCVRLMYIFG